MPYTRYDFDAAGPQVPVKPFGVPVIAVERYNPPLGKFLEIDDTRLHFVERGSGSPVVFLHGNATMLQDFTVSAPFAPVCMRERLLYGAVSPKNNPTRLTGAVPTRSGSALIGQVD